MSDLYSRLKRLRESRAHPSSTTRGAPPDRPVPPTRGSSPDRDLRPGPDWRAVVPGVWERRVPRSVPPHGEAGPDLAVDQPSAASGNAPASPWRAVWRRMPAAIGPYGAFEPVFLDVETSGLSGGAGSTAFLVGLTPPGDDAVVQLFLSEPAAEDALLRRFRELVGEPARVCYVTYNGGSFDLPVLRTRHILNRSVFPEAAHWDLLHLTRRLYAPVIGSCTLGRVESRVLRRRRAADIPGSEVPGRYQEFVRSGDSSLVADVVAHHAYDVLHLVDLATTLVSVVAGDRGADAAVPADAVALARFLVQRGGAPGLDRAAAILDAELARTGAQRERARAVARSHGLAGRLAAGTSPRWATSRELRAVVARRRGEGARLLQIRRELFEIRGSRHDAVEYAKVLEHQERDYDRALTILAPWHQEAEDPELAHRVRRLLRKRDAGTAPRRSPPSDPN